MNIKKIIKHFNKLYFKVLNAGTNVQCLFCNWSGQKFMTGLQCPNCSSYSRERLIAYTVSKFKVELKNKSLIHIGPNISEISFISGHEKPSPYYRLDIVDRKYTNTLGDVTNLKFDNESIDNVLSWHVLEHIPEDIKAIGEIFRVLKKGGKFIVSVPIWPTNNPKTFEDKNTPKSKFEEIYGHPDHCRACGFDYEDRFVNAGFKVEAIKVWEQNESDVKFFGLNPPHMAWCCTKQ